MRCLAWGAFLLLVTGCGFHLRGNIQIPPSLKTLQLLPNEPYDPIQRLLRQALKRHHIQILDSDQTSTYVLHLIQYQRSERVVAYGVNAQAQRFALQVTLSYEIRAPHLDIAPIQNSIVRTQEYSINPTNQGVYSAAQERDVVEQELRQAMVMELLRQFGRHVTLLEENSHLQSKDPVKVQKETIETGK